VTGLDSFLIILKKDIDGDKLKVYLAMGKCFIKIKGRCQVSVIWNLKPLEGTGILIIA